jgi:predicted permease
METLGQDVKYALRVLLKNPGFTSVAALTLALGIGANTAIFTIINAVMLRRLPVPAPQELVVLSDPESHGLSIGSQTGARELFAYPEFEYFRDHNHALSGIFAASSNVVVPEVHVDGSAPSSAPEDLKVSEVSGAFFHVLGVPLLLGHTFTEEVDRVRDASPVAVISYNFWNRRFALDPSILGRTLRVYQTSFNIIGVMPPGFFGETIGVSPDFWVPLSMQSAVSPGRDLLSPRKSVLEKAMWLQVIGRRKAGITFDQANAAINVDFQQMLQAEAGAAPSEKDRREILDQKIVLHDGSKGASNLREDFSQPLLVLMAVVGMVLLIACANVANLLLARAAARRKEIAVRLALGAGRVRLLRQLLTESVLLAILGGALGMLIALWADVLLVRLVSRGPELIPLDVNPDGRILGFTLTISLLTGILFGLIPALRATRLDLTSSLKPAARGGTGTGTGERRMPLGKILVISQVAISLALLVVAGLFLRSLQKLGQVELGYARENLLIFHLDPTPVGYKGEATARLYQQLLDRFAAIPGVRGATLSHNGLFTNRESGDPIWVEGYQPKSDAEMDSRFDQVGPNYFTTVGIPVLLGREIGPQDAASAPRVGMINQAFARHFFADRNPLGKHVRDTYPDNPAEFEIVGVVADAKYNSLKEKLRPRFYVPELQPIVSSGDAAFEVRVTANPVATANMIREAVKAADPGLPTLRIRTMEELVDRSLVQERMITKLSSLFGLLALLLASIGLYGVMAFTVARRTSEIGIRMALGAGRGNVLRMVLRETLALVGFGVAIGVPVVLAASQLLSNLLFGLSGTDPVTISLATIMMLGVAATAGYFPARRASRLDPMTALRYE